MATLAEIRADILGRVKGQIISDDERLDADYIDKLIRDKRNFLIHEENRRGTGFHSGFLQDLTCLKIECDRISCEGIDGNVPQDFVTLPTGVVGRISYLGTHDGKRPFSYRTVPAFLNMPAPRFGIHQPVFTIIEQMALVRYVPTSIDRLRLIAALDDPMQKFSDCLLSRENDQYPVPVHLVDRLQNLVLMNLLPTRNIQPDTANNAADETTPADINAKAVQQATEQ